MQNPLSQTQTIPFEGNLGDQSSDDDFFSIYDENPPNVANCSLYSEAMSSKNASLIRWKNIVPFDRTRVKLHPKVTPHDFIEASKIDVGCENSKVISASAPLEEAWPDWWGMVWLEEIDSIYCLTREFEVKKGIIRRKMDRYWPDEGRTIRSGNFEISRRGPMVSVTFSLHKIPLQVRRISSLSESTDGQSDTLDVDLYYHMGWPDHGVPAGIDEVSHMLRKMHDAITKKRSIIVHCSAGCGRTGVMVTALRCLITGEAQAVALEKIRRDRRAMVQCLEQYKFVDSVLKGYRDGRGTEEDLISRKSLTTTQCTYAGPVVVKKCCQCEESYSRGMFSDEQWGLTEGICIECIDTPH